MGVWLTGNHIEIAKETQKNGALVYYGYKDITEEFIAEIVNEPKIQYVQISTDLPNEAIHLIDSILAQKEDLIFRIYGLYGYEKFDISFLKGMPHLRNLAIDCHMVNLPDLIDFNILPELNLKLLSIDAFDLRDYSFVQDLSEDIESISINADTMGGAIKFDCRWLLRYKKMNALFLGKKAKKNLECLKDARNIKSLALRGIKISDFEFLKHMNLKELKLLWNSNNDLIELKDLKTLKRIELWRINKLERIDFLSELENLEFIKLQDLKCVTILPDLSRLKSLKKIVLDNTGIYVSKMDENIRKITVCY